MLKVQQNQLEGLLNTELGPIPRISDSGDLGWGLSIGISNEFPGSLGASL